jgi:hypothetical protein
VTDLVIKIARREMDKNMSAHPWLDIETARPWFDIPNTAIRLEGIRTRRANERAAECAAAIKFDFTIGQRILSPQPEDMPLWPSRPGYFSGDRIPVDSDPGREFRDRGIQSAKRLKTKAEDLVNKEITYTVERTDKGQLYVTVSELPDW